MRYHFISFLLISVFVFSSFSLTHAQEIPEPPVQAVEPIPILVPEPVPAPVIDEVPATPLPEQEVLLPLPEPATPEPVSEEPVAAPALDTTALVAEEPIPIETLPEISLVIRYGENIAWSGTTTVPVRGTLSVTPTGTSTSVTVATDGLLAVLLGVDAASDAFAITDLDYYPAFGSFIVNCITATNFSEACSQWQYVINGQYPLTGIDDYLLSDGDEVFLYFGNPRRVTLSDTDITVNESFTATAEAYDPGSNTYGPLSGYTIGITQPNPNDPWSPSEIATSTSGTNGTSIFTLTVEGAYDLGLKEDFYFPATRFTVASASSSDPGSGGGSAHPEFDFAAAYDFLASGQESDGSWDSPIVTDWAAFALAVPGAPTSMKNALASHLREDRPDLETALDYERRALALMALNINPYTGGATDYITPIVESFDGVQIDEPGLVNDDAFALMTLLGAGYTRNDALIRKITEFIVTEQNSDGSWEGGIDLSGAYVQALAQVASLPGVPTALAKAEAYMRAEQGADGGFGMPSSNAFATSWALQGIKAFGESPENWKRNGHTPLTYLGAAQEEDGGLTTVPSDYVTRAWAVAYAIPAAKGLTWAHLLHDFKKPAAADEVEPDDASSEKAATSTDAVAPETINEPLIEAYVATTTLIASLPEETNPVQATVIADAPPEESRETKAVQTITEPSLPLVAAAAESGAWEQVREFFFSFWVFLKWLFS